MKILQKIGCVLLLAFLLFSPRWLILNAQRAYEDPRFVRKERTQTGTIVLYHIVRHRPYCGSITAWLQKQAEAFEKKHKGVYLTVEGMDEATFAERLEYGRRADAYSFFSGSLYRDLLKPTEAHALPLKDGLFQTDCCVPYAFTGYGKLLKDPSGQGGAQYYANDLLAARLFGGLNDAEEGKAQTLFVDLRRGGDLVRYSDGFALSEWEPIDSFTDAVCWLGIDRDASDETAAILTAFFDFLLTSERQQTLSAMGMFSVRADVKDEPIDAQMKAICRTYASVVTVDPFRWYTEYEALCADAALARAGDEEAKRRFTNRLQELCVHPTE